VIKPEDTREKLIRAFGMLKNKVSKLPKKKHGNIPL
jgi:propionyl-CoA carboxylase beta chain